MNKRITTKYSFLGLLFVAITGVSPVSASQNSKAIVTKGYGKANTRQPLGSRDLNIPGFADFGSQSSQAKRPLVFKKITEDLPKKPAKKRLKDNREEELAEVLKKKNEEIEACDQFKLVVISAEQQRREAEFEKLMCIKKEQAQVARWEKEQASKKAAQIKEDLRDNGFRKAILAETEARRSARVQRGEDRKLELQKFEEFHAKHQETDEYKLLQKDYVAFTDQHKSKKSKITAVSELNYAFYLMAQTSQQDVQTAEKTYKKIGDTFKWSFPEFENHPTTLALMHIGSTIDTGYTPKQLHTMLHQHKVGLNFPEKALDDCAINFAKQAKNTKYLKYVGALK